MHGKKTEPRNMKRGVANRWLVHQRTHTIKDGRIQMLVFDNIHAINRRPSADDQSAGPKQHSPLEP